ncbi:MAG: hypothetical protein D6795_07475, partial [Deltaproteobacteria bacterium]
DTGIDSLLTFVNDDQAFSWRHLLHLRLLRKTFERLDLWGDVEVGIHHGMIRRADFPIEASIVARLGVGYLW